MIALLGALKEEVACLRKRMTIVETVSEDTYTLFRGTWQGRGVLLAQTGMGKQRAQAAARHLAKRYPITTFVSLGFAGGLIDELRPGNVVLYSAVGCAGGAAPPHFTYCVNDDLLGLATKALKGLAGRVLCRRGVTTPYAVISPKEKDDLANTHQAVVVDMESYWIAEIASENRIPLVIIRSVSDTKHETLLPFEQMLTEDGDVVWRAAFGYFLRQPQHLAVVVRLHRNARVAARSLAAAVECLIAEI